MGKFNREIKECSDPKIRIYSRTLKFFTDYYLLNSRPQEQDEEIIKAQIDQYLPLIDPSKEKKSTKKKRDGSPGEKKPSSTKTSPEKKPHKDLKVKKDTETSRNSILKQASQNGSIKNDLSFVAKESIPEELKELSSDTGSEEEMKQFELEKSNLLFKPVCRKEQS